MIPEMTDPLGRYWEQPRDIREAPMDDKVVLLTPWQFEGLAEYSTSTPSGVYVGKCWKREEFERVHDEKHPTALRYRPTGKWHLGWYGECDDPKFVSNNWREIIVVQP